MVKIEFVIQVYGFQGFPLNSSNPLLPYPQRTQNTSVYCYLSKNPLLAHHVSLTQPTHPYRVS